MQPSILFRSRIIITLLSLIILTALAGCLPKSEVIIPTVQRTLIVDLRPGREVDEGATQQVAHLLRSELAKLPALEVRTISELTEEAGGTLRLAEEDNGALLTPAEVDSLGTQLYLIGTLTNFTISTEENDAPGERMGFHRELATVELTLRLYLSTSGELLTSVSATHEHFKTGDTVEATAEFRETLAGRAALGAIEKLLNKLTDTINASPWSGFVSEVTGADRVLLPLGYEQGAQTGDVFIIYSPSETPGERGVRRGSVVIETTAATESYALPLSGGSFSQEDLTIHQP